jgi:hypothetical protein
LASNDPTETGGLFIGRRPGTAPLRYRAIGLGIAVAFVGMLLTILGTIGLAMRLDRAWMLVRRASGHEQEKGALERIFVTRMILAGTAFTIWFLIVQGPGPDIAPRREGVPGARQ